MSAAARTAPLACPPLPAPPAAEPALPEAAAVPWRRRVDAASLDRRARWWTATMIGHTATFTLAAGALLALSPLTIPVALILLAKAWIIPELYAARGANVLRPPAPSPGGEPHPGEGAQLTALGLLGDLTGHEARALHERTGLVTERGRLGVWLIGEAGAVLVRRGGRRVHCFCVRVDGRHGLPPADRTAHLLLALRADEQGFATVANQAFCGGRRRLRRRIPRAMRPALDTAAALDRT